MAKKRDAWSFVDQPRWLEGALHYEFIEGRRSDYALQLGAPVNFIVEAGEPSVAVHIPPGALGYKVFELAEPAGVTVTANPIVQGLLEFQGSGYSCGFMRADDERVFSAVKTQGRRHASTYKVKGSKPIVTEAFRLATDRLAAYRDGALELQPEPVEVPMREGKTWLWSARWRERYAEQDLQARPEFLGRDGKRHYLGVSNISFEGTRSS